MIDDVRIVVPIEHHPFGDHYATKDRCYSTHRRVKLEGKNELTIRVRSVRDGTAITIEGSFAGFLQGHNVVGPYHLRSLVYNVCVKVFQERDLAPTPELLDRIRRGHVKLERIDVVGFLDCEQFGGPASVIALLDAGLGGRVTRTYSLRRPFFAMQPPAIRASACIAKPWRWRNVIRQSGFVCQPAFRGSVADLLVSSCVWNAIT
jgi:hypothetical protein